MRPLREALILFVAAAAPAALAVMLHPQLADRARAGLEPGAVRLVEVRAWHADVLWVDGRSAEDFARDHIPGALPLEEARFSEQLGPIVAAWKPGQRIVVYCSSVSCSASKTLAQQLRDAGFTDVHHLHGGWEAWQAAAR
jgi:rhodanese-related sulfurtransferase